MGGSAFAAGAKPLHTPRMPKSVYNLVKSRCHAILRDHYYCVASPIDGPGKKDFGDVDILTAWPKYPATSRQEALETMSKALNATRMIADKGKDISGHLAIPWPEKVLADSDDCDKDQNETSAQFEKQRQTHPGREPQDSVPSDQVGLTTSESSNLQADLIETSEERFIQVDVRVCETLDQLQWMLFKHAHGDMWNLLGSTIRPYGLTVDEVALWLRIPEIEDCHRNRAKVFLSSDPVKILSFLGLPIEGYWEEPFDSLDAMYEYASLCRMFWIRPVDPEEEGDNGREQDRKKLKANDRRRMNQRPGFRRWIEEFIPRCREEGKFLVQPTAREAVTEEAFAWFGVKKEFTTRRDEFLLEKQKDMIWRELIKGSFPAVDPANPAAINYRSCLVKALKRVILENDDRYGILPDTKLTDDRGFYVIEDVLDFIARRQDDIGKAAWALIQKVYMESKLRKTSLASETASVTSKMPV